MHTTCKDSPGPATVIAPPAPAVHGGLDPRTVILLFLSGALWIGSCRTVWGAAVWVGIALLCALSFRRRDSLVIGTGTSLMRWAVPMAAVVALLYSLLQTDGGPALISLGPVQVGRDGLVTGIRLGLRLIAFAGLTAVVANLATPSGIASGMTRLLLPFGKLGLPVASVYYLMFFMLRMFPLLSQELQTIRLGQRSRGVRFDGPWRHRIRMSAGLIVPAFAAALRRSDRLSDALASRGFDVRRIPASVMELRLSSWDWVMLIVLAAGWAAWAVARLAPVDLLLF